ncbi:hypothetical protein M0R04_05950 [Candidatus Dojkabacteria bacterium]|jgi:uncharacterized membrane protein YeaQ/YmgE (transglycosylase-associated protein family)|nr:hypothetical protein [Candidatus Dojkabacteria bacterium]
MLTEAIQGISSFISIESIVAAVVGAFAPYIVEKVKSKMELNTQIIVIVLGVVGAFVAYGSSLILFYLKLSTTHVDIATSLQVGFAVTETIATLMYQRYIKEKKEI